MISVPSYYLHLSFIFHVVGFTLLIIGYSTPYWTVVFKLSGHVHNLGLLVSCDKTVCELLHITEARGVAVIVFGISTVNILLSLFISQLFCLSVCNDSCRSKNMGIGLSYLCFLVALSVAVTQVLYQIDLKEEETPDVTSMKIGWSRYTVIVSSITFSVAALLSIADYIHRNQFSELRKKCADRNKMAEVILQNRQDTISNQAVDDTSGKNMTYPNKQIPKTDDLVVKPVSGKQERGLKKSVNEYINNCQPKTSTILVSEVHVNSCGIESKSHRQKQAGLATKSRDREGLAIVTNALQKQTLTKTGNGECMDKRHCLPSVEEEKICPDKIKQTQNKKMFNRQMAITDDNGHLCETSVVDNAGKTCVPSRMSTNATVQNELSKKRVFMTEKSDLSLDNMADFSNDRECEKRFLYRNTMETVSHSQRTRRNSAIEDALLSVSHMLDTPVSGGHTSAEQNANSNNNNQLFETEHQNLNCPLEILADYRPVQGCRKTPSQTTSKNDYPSTGCTSSRGHEVSDKSLGSVKNISRWSKFRDHMSEEQMKRSMIVEGLSRDLDRRRKQRITE